MNEFEVIDQLERELGPTLRLALRRVAAEIPDAATAWSPQQTVQSLNGEHSSEIDSSVRYTTADDQARERRPRWQVMMVAASTIFVLVLGLLALAAVRDPDKVRPDTVPATTVPSVTTESATTTAPTTTAPAIGSIDGREITVTPDSIEFGEYLVGWVGRVARADGRTYVLPGLLDELPASEGEYQLIHPERAVLAAFDDAGRELWRTELDGFPSDVVVVDGDPWVSREDGTVSRIDATNGRTLGSVALSSAGDKRAYDMIGAFGSVWVHKSNLDGRVEELIRVDPDMTMRPFDLPPRNLNLDGIAGHLTAGVGAIWVPLGYDGVAIIEPVTGDVTVISGDDLGHEVLQVAFDGQTTYVASRNRVTSIVDGAIVANASPGQIEYLGPMDGAFGALVGDGSLVVLTAKDPMVLEHRAVSQEGRTGPVGEIDGEAWMETGRNYDLRRSSFLATS